MDHINTVTPEEVRKLLEEDDGTVVVDVREDDEVAQGMIENAKHIPLENIPHSTDKFDENSHYILVCRSGRRSLMAASFLEEHGFNVSNMEGGMLNWDGEVTA
ncbi:Rhodanese-related sulfurtransferase [Lentibacillus persicus]|uniref:Rhodanese-related sulfurtransferase n=1 Tax=Lentibacillus persicus TaxID=640948 RepID=A0A1I1WD89_9BACI|nr:rhodanese-like domain-containing protein [Lentibacillus persicus]SFD93136.1 Rhodanese-related sulfurtransferase [Lentibacillus persicus]